MRFLDANVFIYAFYKPRKKLSARSLAMKELAKDIVRKVMGGERVLTTVVHLSEVANIIKHALPEDEVCAIVTAILRRANVVVVDVSRDLYLEAALLGQLLKLDPNDALAVLVMREHGVSEIYTFDRDFDRVEGIRRIPTDEEIERKAREIEHRETT